MIGTIEKIKNSLIIGDVMKSGLNKTRVKEISKLKGDPKWMLDFRLKAYDKFMELSNPIFGPELKINFDDITYYKRKDLKIKFLTVHKSKGLQEYYVIILNNKTEDLKS